MNEMYERLDAHEIEDVRALRRSIWIDRAAENPDAARRQVVDALAKHADAWVDGISLVTLVRVAFRHSTVGDLSTDQRYSLISLLRSVES